MQIIDVPTGKIITDSFTRGPLEFLSIGDYGQAANIKADFLGMDSPINGVPNGKIMPLEEKWVITISTQYGCNMKCKFCDVPLVGPGKNVSADDMLRQIQIAREPRSTPLIVSAATRRKPPTPSSRMSKSVSAAPTTAAPSQPSPIPR